MVEKTSFRVEMQTTDPRVLVDFFDIEMPAPHTTATLDDGLTADIQDVRVNHGLVETAVIVNFVITVASGVATKVVSDLLLERLRGRNVRLRIDDKPIDTVTSATIKSAIDGQ